MKKLIISGTLCAVALLGGSHLAYAEETTAAASDTAAKLSKIEELMKLIASLQAKLAEARGEVQELTKDLSLGAKDDDVKKIQEILASDPTLFGVKPTGYYGPLTEAAIKKFQERYGLPVTGIVDEATREVMKELRKERKNGMVPPGLVQSNEVKDRIKARLEEKWGDCVWGEKFRASDCKKDRDDDETEESDDDSDDMPATRAEAQAAIQEAKEAVIAYREDVAQMEEDDVAEDELEAAEDLLADANKKLADARRALAKREYSDAVEKAEKILSLLSGEDEDDDEGDEGDKDEDDE